jgi:hypothetical protein
MLWQCHQDTEIVFIDCLWPEFDIWKFMPILLEWQWRKTKDGDSEVTRGRKRRRAGDFVPGKASGVQVPKKKLT